MFLHALDFSKAPRSRSESKAKLTLCDPEPPWRQIDTVFDKTLTCVLPPKPITSLVFDQAKQSLTRWNTPMPSRLFLPPTHTRGSWINPALPAAVQGKKSFLPSHITHLLTLSNYPKLSLPQTDPGVRTRTCWIHGFKPSLTIRHWSSAHECFMAQKLRHTASASKQELWLIKNELFSSSEPFLLDSSHLFYL